MPTVFQDGPYTFRFNSADYVRKRRTFMCIVIETVSSFRLILSDWQRIGASPPTIYAGYTGLSKLGKLNS